MRQVALGTGEIYNHVGVSRLIVDNRCFYSNKGIMSFAPLYLNSGAKTDLFDDSTPGKRRANLAPGFIAEQK